VEYLAEIGRSVNSSARGRQEALEAVFSAIVPYERSLCKRLVHGLKQIPGLKLYGISDPARFAERCPTIAVRVEGHTPLELARSLGERGFFTWDGNYYALNLTERLDVEKDGGFLRIGLYHYNTVEEVDGLLGALGEITC
jgi:selenocysteine lyase/cysteine desulfurase